MTHDTIQLLASCESVSLQSVTVKQFIPSKYK